METAVNASDLHNKVEAALDTIRPYLKADGGDVKIVDISKEGILKLELLGSCESCPMSAMTMKAGIEESVRKAVPEISVVEAVNLSA
ncbi:MAG: NifU family protein [Bacteroidota bacterium]